MRTFFRHAARNMRALMTTSSTRSPCASFLSHYFLTNLEIRARSRPPRIIYIDLPCKCECKYQPRKPTFFIARSATISQQMVRTVALYKQLCRDYGSNNSCLLRSLLSRVSYVHNIETFIYAFLYLSLFL